MNAISPIEPCMAAPSGWPEIKLRVNAWRGRCTDLYTRAEEAVSDTLLALSTVPVRGQSVTIPHLVGQRFAALAKVAGSDGVFAEEGQSATKALAAFRAHEALRTYLCHGVATVTRDQKDHVYVIFRIMPFQKGKAGKEIMIFDETRMEATLRSLMQDGQRLADALSKLRGFACERHDLKI